MLISLGAGQPVVLESAGGGGTEEAAAASPCSSPGSTPSLSSSERRKDKVFPPYSPDFPFHSVYWDALFLQEGSSKQKKSPRNEHQDEVSTDASKGKYRC